MDMSKYDTSFDPDGVIELENLILEGNVFSLAEGHQSGTYKFYVGISYKNDPVSMEVTLEGTVPVPTPDPDKEPTLAPQPTSKPAPPLQRAGLLRTCHPANDTVMQ